MFDQNTFARQQNSVFNSQINARYASAFDSATLEPALTPSRSTASYQAIPLSESFNQVSIIDAGIPTESMATIGLTQAVNPTWNTEAASSWNLTTAWNNSTTWGTDSSDFSGIRPAGLSLKNAWNSVKDKAKKADWKKIGHGALDAVGMLPIPVVSTAADLVNAGWYAAEGDYKNAAMSAIGAAPGVGDGAKLALKAADAAKTARSARTTTRLTTRAADTPRPGLAPDPKPSARRPEPPTATPRRQPSGRPDSNPVSTPARRSARRSDPSPSGAVRNPEPRRPDPQPNPAPAKKPEPSRPEGNPPPSGSREQPPQRPAGQPESGGARTLEQRPETPVASRQDPRLQETPGSVRPTGLERFTQAMNRTENLSQRLDQINGHVDLLQPMQDGNAETGDPSAADFAFAAVDAFFGMRSGRGGFNATSDRSNRLNASGSSSVRSESSTDFNRQREIQVPGSEAQRQPHNRPLNDEEIQHLTQIVEQVRGNNHRTKVRFNQGRVTGYNDETDMISVRGSVYPDPSIDHPRSRMSEAATLAHEFGHANNRGTHIPKGEWRDEFRASYQAALHAPGLSDQDRRDLMHDAVKRVEELRENIIRFGNGQGMQLRNGNTAIVDIDRLLTGVRRNVHVQRWAPKPERRQSAFGEIEE